MSKDPAILFYTSDFLTGTSFMSNEQVGIYIKLLCLQHQHGGELPKESFNNIIGNNDIIRNKFIETEDGFYNERMMNEMIKRKKKSSSLSANALKRWEKEKQKDCKSNAIASNLHMPIEDRDEDRDVSISVFEELWNNYPKKDGKKQALKHYKASVKTKEDMNNIYKAALNYKQYIETEKIEVKFIKNGSTWFNNWQDWVEVKEYKVKNVADRDTRPDWMKKVMSK